LGRKSNMAKCLQTGSRKLFNILSQNQVWQFDKDYKSSETAAAAGGTEIGRDYL
jgi:phage antirepressor YoqD-like protein